jgi:hypothetical protein
MALLLVLLACSVLALRYGLHHGYSLGEALGMASLCTLRMIGGPLTLWYVVLTQIGRPGETIGFEGFIVLAAASGFSFLPWIAYVREPCRTHLATALGIWFFVGYFFGIGVLI